VRGISDWSLAQRMPFILSFNKIFGVVNRINDAIKKRVKGRVGEGFGGSSTG
jgi:hypothetical protein